MFYCQVQITECFKWKDKAAFLQADLDQHKGNNKKCPHKGCPHKDEEQMSELSWSNVLKKHHSNIRFMEEVQGHLLNVCKQRWELREVITDQIQVILHSASWCIVPHFASLYVVLQCTIGSLLHLCVSVRSVPDILFYFISAGGGLRMGVEERNPRVESKTHRGGGRTGEASAAPADYNLHKNSLD